MVIGMPGGPGEAAPRPVPPAFRKGAESAATATQPALETRVVAPVIRQECATLSTAVSDLLCRTLTFSKLINLWVESGYHTSVCSCSSHPGHLGLMAWMDGL